MCMNPQPLGVSAEFVPSLFKLNHAVFADAFRSPGRFEETEFDKPKVEMYQAPYENLRHGLRFGLPTIRKAQA
jgi:hypothetical protein